MMIMRFISLILEFIFGSILGGVIAFGLLNQGFGFSVFITGLFTGSVLTAISYYQKSLDILGQEEKARRWRLSFNLGRGAIILFLAVLVLIQLYSIGTIPVPGESRASEFKRLMNAIENHYVYADLKGINIEELRERYIPKVLAATDDKAYFMLLDQMFLKFNDAHTELLSPPLHELIWFGLAREVEDLAVVTAVRQGLNIPGLQKGAVIKKINNMDIETHYNTVSSWQRQGSTERQRRVLFFSQLLTIVPGEEKELTLQGLEGETIKITLKPELIEAIDLKEAVSHVSNEDELIISGKKLLSGLGYIQIPTFKGDRKRLVSEFDYALASLNDSPGIILDLRGNGGGSTFIAHPLAGRFFGEPFTYGRETFKSRLPIRAWAKEFDYTVRPRGETYEGQVIIIVDTWNMSTAENFIAAMKDSGRATIVGRPTAGSSGNPVTFNLREGKVRFSTGDFRRTDGQRIEGIGFQPHFKVEWTIEDIVMERDPDIKAAEEMLLNSY